MRTVIRPLVPRMEFGVCLLHRRTPYSFLATFLFLLFTSNQSIAQSTSMNCYAQVNVSLNYTGEFRLTVDRLSGMSNSGNTLVVELIGRDEPIVDCREAGEKVQFIIRDTVSKLHCWGYVLVEDKLPFEISCKNGTAPCIEGLSRLNPADFIDVTYNCQTIADLNVIYQDSIGALYPTPSDTLREVHRTWSVSDDTGISRQCMSIIYLLPLNLNDIIIPFDTTIYCGQDPEDLNLTGQLNYTDEILNQNCHIAVTSMIKSIGIFNCGSKRKYQRSWAISDWVSGSTREKMQFIIVEDTTIATIIAPDESNVFFEGCNPMIIIDPPADIINNCTDAADADIYVKVDNMLGYANIGDTIAVGIGPHQLIYTGFNACIDYLISDTLEFQITAPTAPVLVCNNSLNRAISMKDQDSILVLIDSAFASVAVTSCIPYRFLARKVNSICGTDSDVFTTSLEFCLAEVCDHILIELVVQDSFGIRSDTCEVWIDVQEKVNPILELVSNPQLLIDSSGIVTLDSAILLASFGDNSIITAINITGSGLGMTGSGIPLFKNGVFQKFTCQDTGNYYVEVQITDCSNNQTIKTTTLNVSGNGNCPIAAPIFTGEISAYGSELMEGVLISAEHGGYAEVDVSDFDGRFKLENIDRSLQYDLTALYDDDWQIGITANDLALMKDYFLGITTLNEFQKYSADVNGSGDISTIDLVAARKIILGLDINFDDLPPWIFNRKLNSGEQESLSSVSTSALAYGGIPLLGMKRGDMDADAMAMGKSRSIKGVEIIKSISKFNHDTYRLNIGSPKHIKALQLMLKINPTVEILKIDSHMDVDVSINDERLDILYYKSISDDPLWIEVITTTNTEGRGNIFGISDAQPALRWNHNGKSNLLKLEYKEDLNFGLYDIDFQAYPNPTTDQITIELNADGLDRSLDARLMISDPLGRSIYNMPVNLKSNGTFISYVLPLPPATGLYIATLWVGDEQRQLKIVKN
jgi:hypothetical protein